METSQSSSQRKRQRIQYFSGGDAEILKDGLFGRVANRKSGKVHLIAGYVAKKLLQTQNYHYTHYPEHTYYGVGIVHHTITRLQKTSLSSKITLNSTRAGLDQNISMC